MEKSNIYTLSNMSMMEKLNSKVLLGNELIKTNYGMKNVNAIYAMIMTIGICKTAESIHGKRSTDELINTIVQCLDG